MTGSSYPTILRALEGQRLPLAFVDLVRFDDNASALRRRAGPLPIRVAPKSIRCAAPPPTSSPVTGAPTSLRARAGELREHFATLHLIAGGKRIAEAKTCRDEGRCIL